MRLFLIRHPRTLAAANICYGSTDVAVGPDENARVVAALRDRIPHAAVCYSSPLQRCVGLAQALFPGPYCLDPRLAEMHFGDWEGHSWDVIDRQQIDGWASDLAGFRPGGGESVIDMTRRVQSFRDEVASRQQDSLVVCHAGTIRLLLALQLGLSITETALRAARTGHAIGYGELVVIDGL